MSEKKHAGDAILRSAGDRGITEVLHFTTNRGLIGMLASGAVLSRDDLIEEQLLESVKLLNCASRSRDAAWTGYVNLSLTRVNQDMLKYSRGWHENDGIWWAVLAFEAKLLADTGVYFTTTNNAYPVVRRAEGAGGFDAMFANEVPWGKFGSIRYRAADMDSDLTTDPQAEVLYPHALPLSLLSAIYVPEPHHLEDVAGMLAAFTSVPDVPVICRPEVFD